MVAYAVPSSSLQLQPEKEKSLDLEIRDKAKTSFKKQPRNSLRSLSLNRTTKLKKEEVRSKTIFRSPSIYDDPKPLRAEEEVKIKGNTLFSSEKQK